MNKLFPLFAAALTFFACTADDSSSAAVSIGEEKYARVLKKGESASLECRVFADDNTITLKMTMDMYTYSSSLGIMMQYNLGDPSIYRAEMDFTGVMQTASAEACKSLKANFSAKDEVSCSTTSVKGKAELGSVTNEIQARMAVLEITDEFKEKCDGFYEDSKDDFEDLPGAWVYDEHDTRTNKTVPNGEQALSCDVNFAEGVLLVDIVYADKSARIQMSPAVENGFMVSETYTGLTTDAMNGICAAYLSNNLYLSVDCGTTAITYNSLPEIGTTLEEYAVSMKKDVCPAMLAGEASLSDWWYHRYTLVLD